MLIIVKFFCVFSIFQAARTHYNFLENHTINGHDTTSTICQNGSVCKRFENRTINVSTHRFMW